MQPKLRAVVLGSSVAVMVRPRPTGPDDVTYARHLERELRARGHDAEVANEGRWFDMVDRAYGRWEGAVGAHAPDVVILNFGFVECQSPMVPYPVHRWVLDWNTNKGLLRGRVREIVGPVATKVLGWWTPMFTSMVGQRGHKRSPKRFAAEMARLIRTTRVEIQASVLVLAICPPSGWLLDAMPGIDARIDQYNGILQRAVARADDPLVRFVSLQPVIDKIGPGLTGDGVHFTPEGHRLVAAMLADAVEDVVRDE